MARTAFKIPLQSEVSAFMQEVMKWPESFCKHYADKFWNHYQSAGWKLSNGNAMKDWKACFHSQWKRPKFKEDIDLLNETMKTTPQQYTTAHNGEKVFAIPLEIQEIDAILSQYEKHPTSVDFISLARFYPYLHKNKLLKTFTQAEIENIRISYPNDNEKCRACCVQMTFDGYVKGRINFKTIYEVRMRLSGKH